MSNNRTTAQLLRKKLKRNLKYEEIPMDENLRYIILCYQKASIAYRIGENKQTNTTSIQAYFEGIITHHLINQEIITMLFNERFINNTVTQVVNQTP